VKLEKLAELAVFRVLSYMISLIQKNYEINCRCKYINQIFRQAENWNPATAGQHIIYLSVINQIIFFSAN